MGKENGTLLVVKTVHLWILLAAILLLLSGYALGHTTKDCPVGEYGKGINDALLTILDTVQQNGYATINAGGNIIHLAPVQLKEEPSSSTTSTSTSMPALE